MKDNEITLVGTVVDTEENNGKTKNKHKTNQHTNEQIDMKIIQHTKEQFEHNIMESTIQYINTVEHNSTHETYFGWMFNCKKCIGYWHYPPVSWISFYKAHKFTIQVYKVYQMNNVGKYHLVNLEQQNLAYKLS